MVSLKLIQVSLQSTLCKKCSGLIIFGAAKVICKMKNTFCGNEPSSLAAESVIVTLRRQLLRKLVEIIVVEACWSLQFCLFAVRITFGRVSWFYAAITASSDLKILMPYKGYKRN